MGTVLQHGTCQRSSITSGILYVNGAGTVLCSRCGTADVPTMAEIVENLDPSDTLTVDGIGTLIVSTS